MTRAANLWRDRFEDPRPLIVAHRGDSAHAPENTLEAACLAFEAGAEAWEFDVRLSRDGQAVVIHDAYLKRTTDAARRFKNDTRSANGRRVDSLDLADLLELDAGSWFIEAEGGPRSSLFFGTREHLSDEIVAACRSGSVRLPTLRQALRLTVESGRLANVELKIDAEEGNALVGAVLAEVAESSAEERVLISSFDHEAVARVARSAPRIATGVLSGQPLFDPGRYVREWIGADAYHSSIDALGRNPTTGKIGRSGSSRNDDRLEPFASLRRSAVPLLVFTVDDFTSNGLARRLFSLGASGVFSDFPGETIVNALSPEIEYLEDESLPE